jgi:hypothetical protein
MRERKRTDFVVIVRATRTSNHAAALRRSFQPDRARRPALADRGAFLREALKRRYMRSPTAMHCRRVRGDSAGSCDARAPARLGRAHGGERVAEAVHTRNALLHRASGFQRATEIRALPLFATRAGLRPRPRRLRASARLACGRGPPFRPRVYPPRDLAFVSSLRRHLPKMRGMKIRRPGLKRSRRSCRDSSRLWT